MDELMDIPEAARYLRLSEFTLRKMARDGDLPGFKAGRSWRFRTGDLEEWSHGQQFKSRRKRVLHIDDEEAIREVVAEMLRGAGYLVESVADGKQGLESMADRPADVIVLDLHMPDMDGPTVFRKIRQRWKRVPVVILTGHIDSELMDRAMVHGPLTLLSKPVSEEQLLDCLSMAVGEFA